jgi:hypothetical protein
MIRRVLTPDRDHRAGTAPLAADPIAHPAAIGAVERACRRMRVGAEDEDGCGNDAPMEITERFPQPLGNLAQNARFPHSHKPSPFSQHKTKPKTTTLGRRLLEAPLDTRPSIRTR